MYNESMEKPVSTRVRSDAEMVAQRRKYEKRNIAVRVKDTKRQGNGMPRQSKMIKCSYKKMKKQQLTALFLPLILRSFGACCCCFELSCVCSQLLLFSELICLYLCVRIYSPDSYNPLLFARPPSHTRASRSRAFRCFPRISAV